MSGPPSGQERIEYLSDHLPYEMLMLRYTHERLKEEMDVRQANALIESFCVHGRNLIDFFLNLNGNVHAMHFIGGSSVFATQRQLNKLPVLSRLYGKMHQQLLHMGTRTKKPHEKFGADDRQKVRDALESEWQNFTSELGSNFTSYFDAAAADVNPSVIVNSTNFSATGHVTEVAGTIISTFKE